MDNYKEADRMISEGVRFETVVYWKDRSNIWGLFEDILFQNVTIAELYILPEYI